MSDPKLQEYMDQTVTSFSEAQNEIADALSRIFSELGGDASVQRVQLLALRRYVIKGGHGVAEAWPWNAEQARQHKADTEKMNAAAKQTMKNFHDQNPELRLGRSQVRDLPRQVHLWCSNDKVRKASAHLLPRAFKELSKVELYPEIPTDAGPINAFKNFLRHYMPVPEVTSAAPGTSDHGQDRAVDFVVIQGAKTLAGTSKDRIPTDWQATGYDKALKKATKDTGLDGPLQHPHEPWHYWLKKEDPEKAGAAPH